MKNRGACFSLRILYFLGLCFFTGVFNKLLDFVDINIKYDIDWTVLSIDGYSEGFHPAPILKWSACRPPAAQQPLPAISRSLSVPEKGCFQNPYSEPPVFDETQYIVNTPENRYPMPEVFFGQAYCRMARKMNAVCLKKHPADRVRWLCIQVLRQALPTSA